MSQSLPDPFPLSSSWSTSRSVSEAASVTPTPNSPTDLQPTQQPLKKPTQIKFFRPAQMALFAKVSSYPPLEQVTVVAPTRDDFSFVVVIESSTSLPERPWEASIWYDHAAYSGAKESWRALDLDRTDYKPIVLSNETGESVYKYTFTGTLPSPYKESGKTYKGRRIPFTIRYRIDDHSEWSWVYTNFGTHDGQLILQPPIDPNFLGASPVELREGWISRKLASEAPEARLYSTESSHSIPPTTEGNANFERQILGKVTLSCRWFALVRIWNPWLAPRHGEGDLKITEPAIMLSFLRSDGLYVVLLAVNGIDECLTHFESDEWGNIVVATRNDSTKDRKFRIIAATAWGYEVAIAAALYEARKLVRQSSTYIEAAERLSDIQTESVDSDTVVVSRDSKDENTITPQWMHSWYDGLAYCTWNSLGQDLNEEKILSGLGSLAQNNINVASIIIDDNWQSLDGVQGETYQFHRGWKRFEANEHGFPQGLKSTVDKIRAKYPAIRDVAVWHALMGYWGGVCREGEIADNYKTCDVQIQENTPAAGTKLAVHPDDIHRMYDDFYRFLSTCGITSVKTDVQFMLDWLVDTPDRRDFTNTYQSAWTQAHLRHFSGKAISCMSQIPQILFHSFLPTNTPAIMLRNSDDFFPDVPTSHPWHIFVNAHNSLFVQHLNVLPDWDMFQTSHPYSGFHAAARCVSGGPIYVTDTPGEHDVDLIHQMTALSPQGQTVILRPSTVGRTVRAFDKYDDKTVLEVGVYHGKAEVGCGLLGLFNIAEHDVNIMIPVTDIPGVVVPKTAIQSGAATPVMSPVDHISNGFANVRLNGFSSPAATSTAPSTRASGTSTPAPTNAFLPAFPKQFVIRSHVSGRITSPISPRRPVTPDCLLHATLPIRGYDIWAALPVYTLPWKASSSTQGAIKDAENAISEGYSIDDEDEIDIAILGLLGKMAGPCAILESVFTLPSSTQTQYSQSPPQSELGSSPQQTAQPQPNIAPLSEELQEKVARKTKLHIQLKALGVLGIWFSATSSSTDPDSPPISIDDNLLITMYNRVIPRECVSLDADGCAQKEGESATVLKVDVERAWNEMELDPGWSNEVGVDLFF